MSNILSGLVWEYAPYTGTRKLILLALADEASNPDGICWPSIGHLAKICGCDGRSVQRHITALINDGWVRRIARPNHSNLYQIHRPAVQIQENYALIPENQTPDTSVTPPLTPVSPPPDTSVTPVKWTPDTSVTPPLTPVSPRTVIRTSNSVVDGGGDTRVHARTALAEKIVNAGDLPRQTNRAALAQLIANHPQISAGEWEFQAAAAAEWFTDHGRRLTLASLGSWIERYLREQRQLEKQLAEEESTSGRPDEHRSAHGGGRPARQSPSQSGTIPHSPENDVLDYYEGPWESEEEWTRRLLVERAARDRLRAGDAGRN